MAEEQAPATEEVAQAQPEEEVSREATEQEVMERPEIIPEKFWDTETGEINLEDMAKSYAHLEKFATGKKEDMREAVIAELTEEARSNAPAEAKDYELPKLVEGLNEEMVESNPLTGWWRGKCHEMGLGQEEFQDGINQYIDAFMSNQPDLESEAQKLGENVNDRLTAVNAWAQKNFPPEQYEYLSATLGTSADGIETLESIMEMVNSTGVLPRSSEVAVPEKELSIEDVKAMMNDKRYFDNRHREPAYVKKVDEAWSRLQRIGKV